jgi:DNA-binding beta-propeller fold protein YncE
MKPWLSALMCAILFYSATGYSQVSAPSPSLSTVPSLKLVKTYALSADVKGNFDHLAIDAKRNRLFLTPEDYRSVLVLDVLSGKPVQRIEGISRPHAILYRADIDRLYVTDGEDGSVHVFSGENYREITRIPLLKDADSIGYDISRKYLYVDNGGGDVGQKHSMLSVIDTNDNKKQRDISIDGDTLEAMALDNYRPRLYVNDKATSEVVVVDRYTNTIGARWPITRACSNVAMALDEQRQRLFIGCRSGQIVVLDSNTGKELQTLPIHAGVDDLIYDPATRRIYASTDGFVDVFDQTDLNHYASRGSVESGRNGRTARFVPELNRLFVSVPQTASATARVLEFEPQNMQIPRVPPADVKETVQAPTAEKIVLEELSKHPTLRKMGLHVIPPGGQTMILIANGNQTRLGIHTSESDFAAVKSGSTYGPRIADGEYYNIKMAMFDAQDRKIGILVMEIPCTDATSEADAAHIAESFRSEVAKKIPSLEALFAAEPE